MKISFFHLICVVSLGLFASQAQAGTLTVGVSDTKLGGYTSVSDTYGTTITAIPIQGTDF